MFHCAHELNQPRVNDHLIATHCLAGIILSNTGNNVGMIVGVW
jgi:hypothetical protein